MVRYNDCASGAYLPQKGAACRTWTVPHRLWLALAAIPVAALRYFMKGWLDLWGVGPAAGLFPPASLTVLLLSGVWWIFSATRPACPSRVTPPAAGAFTLVALWCEALVNRHPRLEVAHADTYYSGPWEAVRHTFDSPAQHAFAHALGFPVRLALGLALGAGVFRLRRPRT